MTKSPFTIRLDRDKAFACIKPSNNANIFALMANPIFT